MLNSKDNNSVNGLPDDYDAPADDSDKHREAPEVATQVQARNPHRRRNTCMCQKEGGSSQRLEHHPGEGSGRACREGERGVDDQCRGIALDELLVFSATGPSQLQATNIRTQHFTDNLHLFDIPPSRRALL